MFDTVPFIMRVCRPEIGLGIKSTARHFFGFDGDHIAISIVRVV
jgi:hypothetical protein